MSTVEPTEKDVQLATSQAKSAAMTKYLNLVQSGVDPASAAVKSGIVATGSLEEATLEQLMFQRILHPNAKVYSEEDVAFENFKPENRQPGELTIGEVYRLVDMLHFDQEYPLTYIAKTLNIPLANIARIKTDLSASFYESVRRHRAEEHFADYLRKSENLMARARFNEQQSPMGHQTRVAAQRLQWDIANKIIDRQQELGILPKNLGQIKIQEEYIVEVRSGGVIGNKKQEIKNVTPPKELAPVSFVTAEQAARINQMADDIAQTAVDLDTQLQELSADEIAKRKERLGAQGEAFIDVS